MGAPAAAAAMMHKEREIVAAFRGAGATAAEKATSTAAIGVHEHLAFARLRRRAVIREAAPGRYYLDELSWEALRRLRQRLVMIVFILGAICVLTAYMLSRPHS